MADRRRAARALDRVVCGSQVNAISSIYTVTSQVQRPRASRVRDCAKPVPAGLIGRPVLVHSMFKWSYPVIGQTCEASVPGCRRSIGWIEQTTKADGRRH